MKMPLVHSLVLSAVFSLPALGQGGAPAPDPRPPHIDKIVAPSPQAGETITVMGEHFGTERGMLWIGNGPAIDPIWSDTQIVAKIPATAVSGAVYVARKDSTRRDPQYGIPSWVWSDGMQYLRIPTPPAQKSSIAVLNVGVYDDALLQQMLDADRARLMGMQFLDQGKVAGNIGTLQGSSMQQTGFSLNLGGPPLPGVSTVLNSGSTQTTQSQQASGTANSASVTLTTTPGTPVAGPNSTSQLQITSPTSSTSGQTNNQTQVTSPSVQTTYTFAAPTAPTPQAAPTNYYTAPSTFSPSASNILNEEVQLNSEVAGLALMMAGPLSDQVFAVPVSDTESIEVRKHHLTVGIPIAITPTTADSGSVAEIVLKFKANFGKFDSLRDNAPPDVSPTITAILPQDKTYNTATISNKSVNLGGGIVTNVLTAGVNFLWQKQTYYVVQAQDTVAFQLPPDPQHPDEISFGWDIRPVLGNATVLPGVRTLFVQLAVASLGANVNSLVDYGTVSVSAHWKKVDKKTNIIADEEFDPVPVSSLFHLRDYNFDPSISYVEDPIDNGDGTVTVFVGSRYYPPSTYIRIGSTTFGQGSSNVKFLPKGITFTVPAAMLATQKATLMFNGTSEPKEIHSNLVNSKNSLQCLTIADAQAVPESATSSIVTATMAFNADTKCTQNLEILQAQKLSTLHLIAVIGTKVFGYRDAPIVFDDAGKKLSFHAPRDLITSTPMLTVERLFFDKAIWDTKALALYMIPTINSATVISKSKENLLIALIGSNLTQFRDPPAGIGFEKDGKTCTDTLVGYQASDTGRVLCVSASRLPDLSQVALTSKSGDLILVELPDKEKKDKPSGATLEPQGSIDAGIAINLTVKGAKLDGFDHVEVEKTKVPAELMQGKKAILVHLPANLVKAPKIVLVFFFKGSPSVSYTVTVDKAS
jgi:hypothetical protein